MSMNPESGGPTTQTGIYFQNCITTLRLAQMLTQEEMETDGLPYGKITSVRAEAFEEIDDTVVTYSSNRTEYIQAKINIAFGGDPWNKLWEHFYKQYSDPTFRSAGGVITLATPWTTKLAELAALLNRSRTSKSVDEWLKRLNKTQRPILEAIRASLLTATFKLNDEDLFQLCRSVYPWLNQFGGDPRETEYFEKKVADTLRTIVTNPAHAFDALLTLTGKGARIRVLYGYDDLVARLMMRGIRALTKSPAPYNVPALSNRYFVGRANELDQIHRLLMETRPAGPRPVGLSGMGGIGKTQIAVEYAYQYSADHSDGLFWINGAEPLGKGFALIGKKLRPEIADQPLDEQISTAATELHSRPKALVIIDNLREPAELTQVIGGDLIPASLPCRLLITTRRLDPERFRPVEIAELRDEDALKLLLRKPSRQPVLEASHPEHKDALAICAMLGNLPLAIEIAGAHLGQRPNQPVAIYQHELLLLGALPLLDTNRGLSANDSATRHDLVVTVTLLSQWEMLERRESRLLLKVAGLSTEASSIPIARLALLSGLSAEADSFFGAPLFDAIDELKATSLLKEAQNDHVRLHPLVCAFVRQQIAAHDLNDFRQECVANLVSAYEELTTLERQATSRGVDAIQEDLTKAYSLIAEISGPTERSPTLSLRLLLLLRLIQREIHSLRDLDPEEFVSSFIQQIHIRALTLGLDQLAKAAVERLAKQGEPYLRLCWRAARESPFLERTFSGHRDWVNGVVLLLGDRLAASVSNDQTIRVWDLITGQLVRTIVAHEGEVGTIALSPDGRYVATGSKPNLISDPDGFKNSEVKIWDVSTWSELLTIDTETLNWPHQLLITPDSKRVIAACFGEHFVWDLQTGKRVSSWRTGGTVRALAVTPDGRKVLCGSSSWEIEVWDVESGNQLYVLDNDEGIIYALAISSDGRYAFCGADRGNISIWDLSRKQLVNRFKAHRDDPISCLKITSDGQRLISSSYDCTIRVWELEIDKARWEPVHVLAGHSKEITALSVTADGKRIVSSSVDQTLKLWDLSHSDFPQETFTGHSNPVHAVSFVDNGKRAFSVSEDGLFIEWDIQSGRRTRAITTNTYMSDVQITPNGAYAIGIHDYSLRVWRLRGEAGLVFNLRDALKPLDAVAITSCASHAISSSWDEKKTIQIWNLIAEEVTPTTLVSDDRLHIRALLLTPDEQYLVYRWVLPEIRIQNWRTGEVNQVLTYEGELTALAVTPDGKRIVAALDRSAAQVQICLLQVWDCNSGKELNQFEIDGPSLKAIRVSSDGRSVFSLAGDYKLNVWDLNSGKRLATATFDGILSCVAIAPNGVSILIGDHAGNVYCLDYHHP